jgi:hypothetical protein
MGHASIKVILDTYGHLMKDVNKEAASRLGDAIFEQNGSKQTKRSYGINHNPLISLEAATRFELVNSGFADRCLTTWLCRQKKMERETGFEPATSTLARSHSTTELFPLNS